MPAPRSRTRRAEGERRGQGSGGLGSGPVASVVEQHHSPRQHVPRPGGPACLPALQTPAVGTAAAPSAWYDAWVVEPVACFAMQALEAGRHLATKRRSAEDIYASMKSLQASLRTVKEQKEWSLLFKRGYERDLEDIQAGRWRLLPAEGQDIMDECKIEIEKATSEVKYLDAKREELTRKLHDEKLALRQLSSSSQRTPHEAGRTSVVLAYQE